MECECCETDQPTTRKYKGIGYYCTPCMYEGCFSDDCDAQHPYQRTTHNYERTNAVHARLGSTVRGNPPVKGGVA